MQDWLKKRLASERIAQAALFFAGSLSLGYFFHLLAQSYSYY